MGAVTYPDGKVAEFVKARMVPLQLRSDAQPYASNFNVKWTPAIVTLDELGKEHHRIVGFVPPEKFIPAMLLGIAKSNFDYDRFAEALADLEVVIKDYPKSKAAPEAIFLRGVAGYKSTHDPKPLKAAYETLQAGYPGSEWTDRAQPYRLLP